MNSRNNEHIHHKNQTKESEDPNEPNKLVLISYC
jgi:hypothetical protein